MQIVGAHGIPYAATASVGYIDDLRKKTEKAKNANGPAFLHVHAPCPTGWGYDSSITIELAKLAVTTRCWNLYELLDGITVKITKRIKNPQPVKDYLGPQKRFSGVNNEDLVKIQDQIERDYKHLEFLEGLYQNK